MAALRTTAVSTQLFGYLGATVAAGVVMQFDAARLTSALGLAYMQLAGGKQAGFGTGATSRAGPVVPSFAATPASADPARCQIQRSLRPSVGMRIRYSARQASQDYAAAAGTVVQLMNDGSTRTVCKGLSSRGNVLRFDRTREHLLEVIRKHHRIGKRLEARQRQRDDYGW